MNRFLTYILLIFLSISCDSKKVDTVCVDTNCQNYTSQIVAQADFEANRECRADLDADKDGIACEEPGNTVKDCGSTANCGCSNKTKSECELSSCCQWIVGTGCKCR